MLHVKSLALAGFVVAASFAPASADSAIFALRDTEGLATGRFPATNKVNCVEPYCIRNSDGSLNAQKSYEALVNSQSYDRRR